MIYKDFLGRVIKKDDYLFFGRRSGNTSEFSLYHVTEVSNAVYLYEVDNGRNNIHFYHGLDKPPAKRKARFDVSLSVIIYNAEGQAYENHLLQSLRNNRKSS